LIDILIDRRRNSSILDVRSFGAADCDTDHHLVVAKVRERLAVSKRTTHRVHMERFNLKKLNEVEGKEQYSVEISNRFAALENLDTEVDVKKFRTHFSMLSFLSHMAGVACFSSEGCITLKNDLQGSMI
jgi:hypothetical protein